MNTTANTASIEMAMPKLIVVAFALVLISDIPRLCCITLLIFTTMVLLSVCISGTALKIEEEAKYTKSGPKSHS